MSLLSVNLALNVLGLVFDTKEVAIYEDTREVLTGNAIFASSIMSCSVVDDSQLMEHPVESGYTITDHKIFNPIEIDIKLSLPHYIYGDVYRELKRLYDKSPKLRIKTKAQWYTDMVLQALPHEENPENFDRLVFNLHFKQIIEIQPQFIKLPLNKVKKAQFSDTSKLGTNVTNSNSKSSILADGINSIKGLF